MDKEKLMQKLKIKDYNKELEEILISKKFSKDAKNLLSSMLYKIENSYDDYKKTKVDVLPRNELLEEIIEIIKTDCEEIEIVKLNSKEKIISEEKKSIAIREEKKIITYQNEVALLKAIYELNTNKFNEISDEIQEKAFFIQLNEGEITSKSEVIRDFDGWSWNIMTSEIENHTQNLIYQSFVYLLGKDILNKNKKVSIKELKAMIKEKYNPLIAEKIMKSSIQASIINYIEQKPEEIKVLKNIEKEAQKTLKQMEDKKSYIEEITNQKKKYVKQIEKIDKYINDDLELKKEYIKQNEKLPQDQRFFSLSDFSEKIEEDRELIESKIKYLTDKLKPQNFVKEKIKAEKKLEFIKELNEKSIEEIIQEFIDSVLKALNTQIDKINLKKEAIDKIYILRYLKNIYISKENKTGDICKKQFEKLEKNLITIGCNLKALNILSHNIAENYKVYKNIFNTKIIDLESAYIEISKENNVKIYDENSLEKEEQFDKLKELTVRYNKKTKIFI